MTRRQVAPRSAFTLAELLVAVTIGTAILSAALMIFSLSNRSRTVTATARALQTALLIQERFSDDLARLLPAASAPVQHAADKPSRISFYSYDPAAGGPGELLVRPVVYSHDPASGMLVREWDNQPQQLGVAPLKSIEFAPFLSPTGPLVRVTMSVGRSPGEPDGPPTVHSFLARIPAPRQHPSLELSISSPFRSPQDEPADRSLPGP